MAPGDWKNFPNDLVDSKKSAGLEIIVKVLLFCHGCIPLSLSFGEILQDVTQYNQV